MYNYKMKQHKNMELYKKAFVDTGVTLYPRECVLVDCE